MLFGETQVGNFKSLGMPIMDHNFSNLFLAFEEGDNTHFDSSPQSIIIDSPYADHIEPADILSGTPKPSNLSTSSTSLLVQSLALAHTRHHSTPPLVHLLAPP